MCIYQTDNKLYEYLNEKAKYYQIVNADDKYVFFIEKIEEMYNAEKESKQNLESTTSNLYSSSHKEIDEEKKFSYLGSNDMNQQTSEHALHDDKTCKDSNFSGVNSSEIERKFNRIGEAKSEDDSDNEDKINYLKNKYQENSRTNNNYNGIILSSTTSYNFGSSSGSNKNSLATNKNQIESSSENQKYLVDVMVKDYQSSSSTSHKASAIYSNSKEINIIKDFQNENINKIKSTQKHISKVNTDSIYPKGLKKLKNSNLLNENPIESSETPYQTSSINEYSEHTKNYKDIKDEDESYNIEDCDETGIQATHLNKSSKNNQSIFNNNKRQKTLIDLEIGHPQIEESKDNTSNEKEINATASTNKDSYRKPEEDKNSERVKVEIDQENNRLIANIQVIKDSSAKYDNIFNYLLCRIKDSSSIYIDINIEKEVCYTDNIMDRNFNTGSEENDYCVKEITFCNNSSSPATPEIIKLIQRIVSEIKSTELIINKFSFTDLQDILENNINLSFLRIEEIDKFDEDSFFLIAFPQLNESLFTIVMEHQN